MIKISQALQALTPTTNSAPTPPWPTRQGRQVGLKPGVKIVGKLPYNGYGAPRCRDCNDNGLQTVTVIVSGPLNSFPTHGSWTEREGYYYLTEGQRLEPCHCNTSARLEAEARQREQIAKSGLLDSELQHTLDDILHRGEGSARMITAVKDMAGDTPFGMLTLWGGSGNGKTLALQALTNEFIRKGHTARYRTLAQLLNELRGGYADGRFEKDKRYEEFALCRFLAVDEFDKPRMTEFAQEAVFELIDDRYRWGMQSGANQRFTAIAMNVPPDTLPTYLYSRLRWGIEAERGFRIVHNTDDDCRRAGL